jgi:secondary thiamine-phosphate synthase enzyme
MQRLEVLPVTTVLWVRATRALDVIDVTEEIQGIVNDARIRDGMTWVFCRHTTCGLTINEFEDGLVEDVLRRMSTVVKDDYFAHDDLARRTQNLQGRDEPANGAAHVRQIMFGSTSQAVPIVEGCLALGTWQRIWFVELDTPRPRELLVTTLGH